MLFTALHSVRSALLRRGMEMFVGISEAMEHYVGLLLFQQAKRYQTEGEGKMSYVYVGKKEGRYSTSKRSILILQSHL